MIRDLTPDRGGTKGRLDELVDLLVGPGASPHARLRARMARFSVNLAGFAGSGLTMDDADFLAVAREAARDLMPDIDGTANRR